jgi:hypothetical protein
VAIPFYPVGDSYLPAVVAIALVGALAIRPARHRLSRRRGRPCSPATAR